MLGVGGEEGRGVEVGSSLVPARGWTLPRPQFLTLPVGLGHGHHLGSPLAGS